MREILPIVFSVLFGACLGSFLNVVAQRTVEERPWWGKERSRCFSCGRVLDSSELIPLVSWILLRGRCRTCGKRIPVRYLLAECTGAATAGFLCWRWGVTFTGLFAVVTGFLLLLNAMTDLYSGFIYDAFALVLGGTGMLFRLGGGLDALADGCLGALVGAGVIVLIILVSRGGMGWGDAWLMAGTGAALGWQLTLVALYLGFISGGIVALGLLLSGVVKRKDPIPLGPFLALGAFLSLLFGPSLWGWFGVFVRWPWS
ncbi:MAG: prepilin peptidase [Synergistaceae bacterium]|nr:prepilin peptidase [Synergistaceae bacterium]